MQLIKIGDAKSSWSSSHRTGSFPSNLEQNMSATTPFEQLSCYHGAQDGVGGRNYWRPWQNGYMHSSVLPTHPSSKTQVDNALYDAVTLMGAQNNFNKPAAGFNNGFSGVGGHTNEFHQFSGSQYALLPWTDPGGIPCDQFGEWNWASGTALFSDLTANPPSMLNLPGYPTLNDPPLTEFEGLEGPSHANIQNAELSEPTSDQLLLPPSGQDPLSLSCH